MSNGCHKVARFRPDVLQNQLAAILGRVDTEIFITMLFCSSNMAYYARIQMCGGHFLGYDIVNVAKRQQLVCLWNIMGLNVCVCVCVCVSDG